MQNIFACDKLYTRIESGVKMNSTFNAFVAFISDDPIMLGLCIAIIVLVILFIIVLIFGGKKEKSIEDANVDNTQELLKTEVNMDALKSTQEYNLSEIKTEGPKEEVIEIPVVTENQVELQVPKFEAPVIETPSLEIPSIDNNINLEDISETEILRNVPVMEDSFTLETEPNNTLENVEVVKEEPKVEDIPLVQKPETVENVETLNSIEEEEDLDDIDLPKLNPNHEETSFMSNFQGESFNLK